MMRAEDVPVWDDATECTDFDFHEPVFARHDGVRDTLCPPCCYDTLLSVYTVAPHPTLDTIVTDGKIWWNLSKVDSNAHLSASIREFDYSKVRYTVEFGWMDVNTFIAYQMEHFDARLRRDRMHRRELALRIGYTPECIDYGWQSFWRGVNQYTVDTITGRMQAGDVFSALFIVYDYNGNLDQQEGRHRALAAKRLGVEKVPVWIARSR